MLDGLGRPQDGLRAIHVGGTNGKGTVAATADSILRESGHLTGLYTSPHLVSFSERITIGGTQAPGDLLESCAAEVLPLAIETDATFFEATTALALAAFARSGVTTAVVEVGLGGRLDATNVVEADVSVVTSIALDHAEYLGTDLEGIARLLHHLYLHLRFRWPAHAPTLSDGPTGPNGPTGPGPRQSSR